MMIYTNFPEVICLDVFGSDHSVFFHMFQKLLGFGGDHSIFLHYVSET